MTDPRGWQPIETAPKDCAILVSNGKSRWITHWHVCRTTRIGKDGDVETFVSYDDWQAGKPTHWMPLPDLPEPPA